MRLSLFARAPFNFVNTVRSHGWYQLAPIQWDDGARVLRKPERLDNGHVILLTVTGKDSDSGVVVDVADKLTPPEVREVMHKVTWMFALDKDLDAFYEMAAQEPRLAHCFDLAYGRLLRSTTLWEDVVRTMMTTNIQWSGTRRLVKALVEYYGDPHADNPDQRAFPTASKIARSREESLRKLGLGYRAPYLLKLARDVASGAVDLNLLTNTDIPTDALRRALITLPGIGPYAAATLLGILGRHDFIPVDTEAMSAVSEHFFAGKPVTAKEINAVFERFGKFKGLAYWFWDYAGLQAGPME
jgi:3-methyladenine DNA glycosylase/8-oxoguanine DNA glycosylase